MLEKWLDKKIQGLGYIRAEDAVAQDEYKELLNTLLDARERSEKRLKDMEQLYSHATKETLQNARELLQQVSSLSGEFRDLHKDFNELSSEFHKLSAEFRKTIEEIDRELEAYKEQIEGKLSDNQHTLESNQERFEGKCLKKVETEVEAKVAESTKETHREIAQVKREFTPDVKELRDRMIAMENAQKKFAELESAILKQDRKLQQTTRRYDAQMEKMKEEQEISNQTIEEFTERYNSVIRPKSRFIN